MRQILVFALAVTLAACGGESKKTDSIPEGIEDEVRAALTAYINAINEGDATAAGDFYDDSGEFYWVERGRIQYDTADAARTSLQNLADSNYEITIKMLEVKVAMLGASSAFASGFFESQFTPPEGESFGLGGWMSVGMVKRDDGWHIAGGHTEAVAVQEGSGTNQE